MSTLPDAAALAGPSVHAEVCRQCGYPRAGLSPLDLCPECGAGPARPGLPIDLADPLWLTQVSRGLSLVLVGWLIGVVSVIGAMLVGILTPSARDTVFSLGVLVASLVVARGWWRATDLESLARFEPPRPVVTLVLRVSAIGLAVGIGVGSIAVDAARRLGHDAVADVLAQASLVTAGLSAMVHLSVSMSFLGRIARAAGSVGLARSCRQGVWMFPIGLAISSPMFMGPLNSTGGWASALPVFLHLPVNLATVVAGIITFIAPLVYPVFTWRARGHVRRALARVEAPPALLPPANHAAPLVVEHVADPGGAAC